jgi:diaminopimelate epimerase
VIVIPFVKAHGARNDFLLTWRAELPAEGADLASAARAICERHTGIGADGWILLAPASIEAHGADAAITLYNSDGSLSEISGNGTRCAAALLIEEGRASGEVGNEVAIATGAGVKRLRLLSKNGTTEPVAAGPPGVPDPDEGRSGPVPLSGDTEYRLEMNMGQAQIEELHSAIVPERETVILNVGNPQCVVFVPELSDAFDFDWRTLGAELERHPRFPNRTIVSFIRVIDRHTLDVRFFERGAGETMSSGTGSTGAVAAAIALGVAESPVRVLTPAGPLELRSEGDDMLLAGPAEIVARGNFFWNP